MRPIDDAEEYRKRAERCVQVAVELGDASQKLRALDRAMAWLRLAEQAAKNGMTDVVYATPNAGLPIVPEAATLAGRRHKPIGRPDDDQQGEAAG